MRRILLVKWGGIEVWGGITVLLINLLQHMDRRDLDIDLYVFGRIKAEEIHQRFSELGVHIICGNHDGYQPRQIASDLHAIMKKKRYDVVHCNTGGLELTAITMLAALLHGVPARIAHSHNSKPNDCPYSRRERMYQFINRSFSTVRLCCSNAAAEHLFGRSGAKRAVVLKNGIETEKYRFDLGVRNKIRRELGLEDALVLGHVGRFEQQKNHDFLLDIFAAVKAKQKNAALLLIGVGSLMPEMQEKTARLGLSESVFFLGSTDRVTNYLQAMDVFVFPPLYEGLGIAAIEAQAADLPVISSDTVPREACITSRFTYVPLKCSAEQWSDVILEETKHCRPRADQTEEIRSSGYDITSSAERLFQLYI